MASQQAFQAYPQNKGTLTPGQTISVNNHTVQVERYLSQGGFAHVYLVRTPMPVYNTTHHVLKRIQVSDESMLTEVRKEVDVMRVLKGHPNIVHLIDAAWHKMPNGMFEVFILMEYCPGGGIIDMMNRRLRERLTEAEILQIFVDVCEGVAYMHNSRPPLLHRDLKVENILQSSPTSFKLCDFGSTTTVRNPPTNTQEIRNLEADLNRHTTLQYRAPEMVDVYSKRPINEKSDVWALGVLLYKLCYYTTPFEEHGPLAIINVQYRTPSYPTYSQDMNTLIASMLREHGAQRPTVFELLTHVHRLRGTKSKFSYNIPVAPSPLLPRTQPESKPSPSPNSLNHFITYTSPPAKSALSLYDPRQNQPPVNQGIQARDRVLEAIAPMRRGRPENSRESKSASSSRPPSPQKASAPKPASGDKPKDWLDVDFGPEQDRIWKTATEHSLSNSSQSTGLGWSIADGQKSQKEKSEQSTGFGDNFTQNLLDSSDLNISLSGAAPARLSPRPNSTATAVNLSTAPIRPLAYTGGISRTNQSASSSKDAFEGLGLMTRTSKPTPTMGEARKLRTGLARLNSPIIPSDYTRHDTSKVSRQPSLSPRPNYLSTTPSHPKTISPIPTPGTSNVSSSKLASLSTPESTPRLTNGLTTESRFPSLEELDARLIPSVNLLYPSSVVDASRNLSQIKKSTESHPQLPSRASYIGSAGTGGNFLKPSMTPNTSHSDNGVRSEQVTGIAMRESKQSRRPENEYSSSKISSNDPEFNLLSSSPRDFSSRPVLVQKHRTTMSMQVQPSLDSSKSVESVENTSYAKSIHLEPPQLPTRPSHPATSRDWLTGDDDHGNLKALLGGTSSEAPILRGSPGKRASYIELDRFDLAASASAQHVIVHDQPSQEPLSADLSPTVSKFKRTFPALETIDTQDLHPSDVSDLVDDRSPAATRDTDQDSSSADEGPEDARRLGSAALKKTSRAKGRQSSVHELVYQYGGGVVQKEKEHERERERVVQHGLGDYVPQSKVRPSGLVLPTKPHIDRKTSSPTSKPLASPIRRSPQHHQSSMQANKPQLPLKANKSPTKSPSSGRSRPQSMFVFPSKSVDSSSLPSPGLVPPQEPNPRAVRRTSISDIVERYEAIGGKARSARPPSPLPKLITTKTTSIPVEPRRIQKPSLSSSSKKVHLSKASMSSDSSYSSMGGDPSSSYSVSKEPPRQAVGLTRTPTKPRKSLALEKGELIDTQTVDNSTPRPRRISRKAEPFEQVIPQSSKTAFTPMNPPRKSTIFGTDMSTPKSEDRSPSPERQYEGVGKLIDQWQKKSAEANSQPIFAGKRFVAKRVGIVHGDDERGQ